MTYLAVATMASNSILGARVTACAAMCGEENAALWVERMRWQIAGQPGWDLAWESAKASTLKPANDVVAADPAVITDGMILAAVQSLRSAS